MCGILSSLLYVVMNVFVAMEWEGYSSASQTVSELSAIGAPRRSLWVLPAASLYQITDLKSKETVNIGQR